MTGFKLSLLAARWLFIGCLIIPVTVGIAGVMVPAAGYFPALGETEFSFQAVNALLATPGLVKMAGLSLGTALLATALALLVTLAILAVYIMRPTLNIVQHVLSPVLVIPHAAAAIAVAFLLAPGGWAARLVSPWLSGWHEVPAASVLHDPWGLSIVLALALKELPFLLLIALGVWSQPHLQQRISQTLRLGQSLGYHPVTAFTKLIWPQLYPHMRLPVLAVLAYASANVEIPLILGPGNPPTLAVAVLQWFNHIDLAMRLQASAAACLQILVTGLTLGLWWLAECAIARWWRGAVLNGRHRQLVVRLHLVCWLGLTIIGMMMVLMAVSLVLSSMATHWPFPALLPDDLTLMHWQRAAAAVTTPLANTLVLALSVTGVAIVISVLALEYEHQAPQFGQHRRSSAPALDMLLFVPLLMPGVAFLFGLTWFAQLMLPEAIWLVTLVSHLVYVLPYVFLSLAVAYRRFDTRYTHVAYGLGASPWRVFSAVRLPLLFGPLCIAMALGLAISYSQYLATLLPGGGEIATLTTEAVAVAAGASRRLSAVYTLMQMGLPLVGFVLAWWLPTVLFNPAKKASS